MKKVVFAAMVATGTLFLTSTLSSCSKVEEINPVEKLANQKNWHLEDIHVGSTDVLPIVTWQFNSSEQSPATLELTINQLNTSVENTGTSSISTKTMTASQRKVLKVVQTSPETVSITFVEPNPGYAGSFQQNEPPSNELLNLNMLSHNYDGSSSGWYTFSSTQMSGIYQVHETTDGFRLIRNDQLVTINLDRELE